MNSRIFNSNITKLIHPPELNHGFELPGGKGGRRGRRTRGGCGGCRPRGKGHGGWMVMVVGGTERDGVVSRFSTYRKASNVASRRTYPFTRPCEVLNLVYINLEEVWAAISCIYSRLYTLPSSKDQRPMTFQFLVLAEAIGSWLIPVVPYRTRLPRDNHHASAKLVFQLFRLFRKV